MSDMDAMITTIANQGATNDAEPIRPQIDAARPAECNV
jgi:hypothetical protein